MDVGQVKTGDDPRDTYTRMLQEIVRVTAPIAYGIAGVYPDVASLKRGLEREGQGGLEDIKVWISFSLSFLGDGGKGVCSELYALFDLGWGIGV